MKTSDDVVVIAGLVILGIYLMRNTVKTVVDTVTELPSNIAAAVNDSYNQAIDDMIATVGTGNMTQGAANTVSESTTRQTIKKAILSMIPGGMALWLPAEAYQWGYTQTQNWLIRNGYANAPTPIPANGVTTW